MRRRSKHTPGSALVIQSTIESRPCSASHPPTLRELEWRLLRPSIGFPARQGFSPSTQLRTGSRMRSSFLSTRYWPTALGRVPGASCSAWRPHQAFPKEMLTPASEVPPDRAPGRELLRQQPPLAGSPEQIEDRVYDRAEGYTERDVLAVERAQQRLIEQHRKYASSLGSRAARKDREPGDPRSTRRRRPTSR